LKDIEIICVCDASPDGSLSILEEYAAKDPRIVVVNRETNHGYGSSVNLGISMAKGEAVGIVDSDDCITPDMFQYMFDAMQKSSSDIVLNTSYIDCNTNLPKGVSTYSYGLSDIVKNTAAISSMVGETININKVPDFLLVPCMPWNRLYRREFIKNIKFLETPGASYQDISFSFKALLETKSIHITNKPLYCYRRYSGSSTTVDGKLQAIYDEVGETISYIKKVEPSKRVAAYVGCAIYIVIAFHFQRVSKKYLANLVYYAHQTLSQLKNDDIINIGILQQGCQNDILSILNNPEAFLLQLYGRYYRSCS